MKARSTTDRRCKVIRVIVLILLSGCVSGGQGSGTQGGTGFGGPATININCLILCTEIRNAGLARNVSLSKEEIDDIVNKAMASRSKFQGARLLWVDDNPEGNDNERNFFSQSGLLIDLARSTSDGLARLDRRSYDVVITDMTRGWNRSAGEDLLNAIQPKYNSLPVIFYTGRNYPKPKGAFGLTTLPDELAKLVFKALESYALPPALTTSPQ
jgi:CheY-like chemotaxis protein